MLLIEAISVATAIAIAFLWPTAGSQSLSKLETWFCVLSRRRALSVVVVGLSALLLRAAVLPILPIPQPAVSDEFSYLLGSDTFAHGRLTNPTHPMWLHFEALHIIQQPTYTSKYPAAQALFLATGQVVTGNPFWGVWLSIGMMCAALCWALQEWVGEGWGLLGGFLAVLHLAIFSYWGDSYWGGAVAATGGALVLGSLPRIQRHGRVRDALLLGIGLIFLANSRPYEGLVFSLPVAVALMLWFIKDSRTLMLKIKNVAAPAIVILAIGAGAMGFYFWRVTGSPVRMPYQVFEATYDPTPYFVWQSPRDLPTFHDPTIHDWEVNVQMAQYNATHSPKGLALLEAARFSIAWLFFAGPLLTVPVVIALCARPEGNHWGDISPPTRFLLKALAVCLAGMVVEVQFFPHYAAAGTVLVFAFALIAIRQVRGWEFRGRPVGLAISRWIPIVAVMLFTIRVAGVRYFESHPPSVPWTSWFSPTSRFRDRTGVLSALVPHSARHLVFVRYGPAHFPPDSVTQERLSQVDDWVYNGADIDSGNVVWARDMGDVANEELLCYYPDRLVWLVDADQIPPRLSPYSEDVAVRQDCAGMPWRQPGESAK